MKSRFLFAAAAVFLLSAGAVAARPSPAIVAAVADKGRPEADVKRDADRKPAEMLDFAGVNPGQTVADFIPGGGYFTRIFAKTVGPKGKVYAVTSPPPADATSPPAILGIAADPQYGNITVVPIRQGGTFRTPEQVDVFWTSQNFHDLYLTPANDVPAITRRIYDAVKPGGTFIVLDHVAAAGADVASTANALHRIDPAAVRKTVEAAGFRFEGESKVLANPADDHTRTIFDPSIRGHTDQFIYKFRKPN